jgi:hypothetical protein
LTYGGVTLTNAVTGTGKMVLDTSPTLVTPALGTPASGVLTNCTGVQYTGFKNRIINGAMVIDQRNAGASVSIQTSNPTYVLDRWGGGATQNSKYTIQQNAGAVTPPAGYSKYLGVTSSSAYSVLAADYFFVTQRIEGFNTIDLGFGTASASSVALSFWVRSSLTGTFGGSITNSDSSRTYPFTYTISSANTWEQKSVTIAGDTTGTWATNNTAGINVLFGLGVGSTYSGTAGSWSANTYLSATGATSVVGTSSATFYITGVQLEKGSTATSFDYRPYGTELALCQRYFYKNQNTTGANIYPIMLQAYSTTAAFGKICDLPVTMRANPTSSTTATSGTFTPSTAAGGSAGAFTGTNIDVPSVNTLSTQGWTGSSGLVAGNATTVGMPNNAFFSASAEL